MDKLSREIIKASKAVRKKQLALKLGRSEQQSLLEERFKPITKLLRTTSDWPVKKELLEPKLEFSSSPIEEKLAKAPPTEPSTPPRKIHHTPTTEPSTPPRKAPITTTPRRPATTAAAAKEIDYTPFSEGEEEQISTERSFQQFREEYQSMIDTQPEVVDDFLEQYDITPRVYIDGLLTDTEGNYDTTTGPHFDPVINKLRLGKAMLEIDGKDLVIGGIRYAGTAGLYELIFKTHPKGYTKNDQNRYRDILKSTSVHHRNYDSMQQVKGSKGHKYINIIQPLIFRPRKRAVTVSGSTRGGQIGEKMLLSEVPYQFVYWDNINELVDRLKLLTASEQAGNTSHTNEIASIIEELREAGVIY